MNNRTMVTNPLIKKYDGKTIRVNKTVYIIEIEYGGTVLVTLSPKFHTSNDDTVARSDVNRNHSFYTEGGRTYQMAVDKAKEICEELERAETTDFDDEPTEWKTVDEQGNVITSGYEDKDGNAI